MSSTNLSNPAPTQVLYCRNLNEKIKKRQLRETLYQMFTYHGVVLDVVALKTQKMRGQAHVIFRDVGSCTEAMGALDDVELFGKRMQLSYGSGTSKVLNVLSGTSDPLKLEGNHESGTGQDRSLAANAVGKASNTAMLNGNSSASSVGPQSNTRMTQEDEDDDVAMDESDGDDAMEESDGD